MPRALSCRMCSDTYETVPPNATRSVTWRPYDAPITTNVGEKISPVPSGAVSVVRGMSPTLSAFTLRPSVPTSPSFCVSAA